MTDPTEDAPEASSLLFQTRRHSWKPSIRAVHDATVTRRPRLSAAPGSRAPAAASSRSRVSLAGASSPPTQLANPSMKSRTSTAATPQNTQEETNSALPVPLPRTPIQPSASTILSTTIQDLEELLNEALHIARVAADDHEADVRAAFPELIDIPHNDDPRRQSEHTEPALDRDRSPAARRLLLAPHTSPLNTNRHHFHKQDSIRPCGPAHKDGLEVKPSVAEPQVSYVLHQDWAPPFLHRRSLQAIEEPRMLAPPDPASLSMKEPLDHILRRKSSKQDLSHRHRRSSQVKQYSRLPVGPRSTSKRSKRPRHSGEDKGTYHQLEEEFSNDSEAAIQHTDHSPASDVNTIDRFHQMFGIESTPASSQAFTQHPKHIDLNGCRHVDVKGSHDFNVHNTRRHQPIARDWEISRKRFAATIACVNTSLIGIIIGIYAGEVPAIQYVIVDLDHSTILGNVVLYLGLAIPTLFFWPLPLMHGRKPYTIMALAIALCLQIPQGIAVSAFRSPYVSTYRRILLLSRALSGFALGFVNINLQATLLDLFGASLQSGNPHQEMVDPYNVRRHGGGMGLWLGLWSWCSVGSISLGFFIGTLIVENGDVTWGFWLSLILMMVVLLLNVIGPEVRRSAYRRTVAEVMGDDGPISRVSRGEIKMHLKSAGPYWWGEEVKTGMQLCWKMFRQPGFAVLAIYTGWAYAHFTLILMVCSPE